MPEAIKETKILMGMPLTVEVRDETSTDLASEAIKNVFSYFREVDARFSTYKPDSEISRINRRELKLEDASLGMREVFALSEQTKNLTDGYFNIQKQDGTYDPSGLVKGWAIYKAANLLKDKGINYFYIDAGGDVQASVPGGLAEKWKVGIRNPAEREEIVKVLRITNEGVATSGTYIRGQHIYNPHDSERQLEDIVSLTVIAENVYEADRFATAAFAMGRHGIEFIEQLPGFEAYQIDNQGMALMTSGFKKYVEEN